MFFFHPGSCQTLKLVNASFTINTYQETKKYFISLDLIKNQTKLSQHLPDYCMYLYRVSHP